MIDIRRANISDAPGLKKLNDLFNGASTNQLENMEQSLNDNQQEIVLVASDGAVLVGFCCGQLMKSVCYPYMYAEITELYVLEQYRQKGIGRKLLEITEQELYKQGAKHLHILTNNTNTAAQALYRSSGYSDTSEILFDKDIYSYRNRRI